MKMKKYYPIQKSGEYSDIYVRLAWDMARMVTTAEERCGWIDDCKESWYGCRVFLIVIPRPVSCTAVQGTNVGTTTRK